MRGPVPFRRVATASVFAPTRLCRWLIRQTSAETRHLVSTDVGVLGILFGVVAVGTPVEAQEGLLATRSIEGDRVRVVFPIAASISVSQAHGLLRVAESVTWSSGLPSFYVPKRSMTICLALHPRGGVSGWRSVASWLVVLPLSESFTWSERKLRRVLQHEFAHILLADFLGSQYRTVPMWFVEGFAEWAAGGLTCEGRVRVEIEIRDRLRARLPLLTLDKAWDTLPTRLAYDVAASFVEFLDRRDEGHVGAGHLLANVEAYGWTLGFERTFGADRSVLEALWLDELGRHQGRMKHWSGVGCM